VVETDTAVASGERSRAQPEQAEVVVVARTGQPHEHGVGARLTSRGDHAEHLGVEPLGAVEVGDEQHGMVETDRRDWHGNLIPSNVVGTPAGRPDAKLAWPPHPR